MMCHARAHGWKEFGLIPPGAAQAVATTCRTVELDTAFFEEVRAGFEATNHSTLGLIHALQRRCPGNSGEWLYYGATVQDITDTWTSLVLQGVREIISRELKEIEANLSRLAAVHRDTVMAGRTHGQIGLPITFGFKAAIWAMEVRRHRQRVVELASRLNVGQLAGGVGSLSSLGPRALELQKSFLARLGLDAPAISWTTARDSLAEWFNLLALIASTGDKIGHEVYNLQRPEIGEVSEGFASGTVGSITMPHKRNPEISEHLGTLARVIRHIVMLALAERTGKQSAHALVYETALNAHAAGCGLKEALLDNPQICAHLSTTEIESLFEYQQHTGKCGAMVDQVLVELRNIDEPG